MSRILTEPVKSPAQLPERRRHYRHVCALDRRGFICLAGERYPWPVRIHNISRGGVSLRLGCYVYPETTARVFIHNAAEDSTVELEARIVWAMGFPNEECVVGCAFTRELTDAELAELL
jgi:hypothetical protein